MLPGVAGIEGRPDRAGTLTILARPGAQILPALNRLIHGSGWRVSGCVPNTANWKKCSAN